jgi:hypothetical protein
MRAIAGWAVLLLASAGCAGVPVAEPAAGGYRGVEQISILALGME